MSQSAHLAAVRRCVATRTPELVRKGRQLVLAVPGEDEAQRVTFASAAAARRAEELYAITNVGDTPKGRLWAAAHYADAALAAAAIRCHRSPF